METPIAPPIAHEDRRVARLRALALLDTAPEPLFDTLTRLAAEATGATSALLSFIDDERQWFKSRHAIDVPFEVPRELSVCAHTLLVPTLLEVEDARTDARFADCPLVTGSTGIRFYAGVPLTLSDGCRIGTLCTLDCAPRRLDAHQRARLLEIARAVTEAIELRERAIAAARAAHALYEAALTRPLPTGVSLLDQLPVAIAVWDRDERNVFANAAMQRLFDHEHEVQPGKHVREVIGAPAYEHGIPMRKAAMAGAPGVIEVEVPRRDGLRVHRVQYLPWRDREGQFAGYLSIAEDITAEREARSIRRALEASERKYRLLADESPLGVYHTDAAGRCTYTNRRWHEIYGMALQDSLGDGWVRTLHPSDRDAVFAHWQRTAALGSQFAMEYRVLRPDGSVRSVRSYACALTDPQGTIEGFVGTVEDITDLREAESHAHELDALLAEREEMLQVLAHEVRQPLNNASAALQSAAARLADQGDWEATQRLARAQHVMGAVVAGVDNTLAAASQLAVDAAPALADVDIDTLVAVTLRDLRTADRARVRVDRVTPTRTVTLDMGLMRLALRNLLANAAEHSPPWSVVTLRIADSDEPLAILFDVIDEGSGIDPAVLPRLFDRGSRGHKAGGRSGHGLGLYIVRRVLEMHGGRAEVLGTGPTGTTIRLTVNQGEPD